jgi:uncharacterized protein (TIGR02302 family)
MTDRSKPSRRSTSARSTGPDPRAGLPAGLGWRLRLARLAVAWERVWPNVWPAAAVLALFLAAALIGLLPALGAWGHIAALIVFAAAFAGLAWRGVRRIVWPGPQEARRRLERDSGLQHRPLAALDDRLAAGGDSAAAALWQAHLERLRATIRKLRVRPPRGSLAAVDPVALRALPVLLLAIGLVVGGAQAPERVARALVPAMPFEQPAPAQLDVWLDPPAYTGAAPQFLARADGTAPAGAASAAAEAEAAAENDTSAAASDGPVTVPDGSRLLAQVSGGESAPQLVIGGDGEAGAPQRVAFEQIAANAWKAEVELTTADGPELSVRQDGAELASWQLRLQADQPPGVAFRQPPQRGQRGALRVAYQAEDDYGIERVRLRIDRAEGSDAPAMGEAIVRELPLPGQGQPQAENASYHDLSAHVWAGTKVTARLIAEDARGQTGESDPVTFTLPQRTFQHPVARRLVELRKRLVLEPDNRYPVIGELSRLGNNPQLYNGDVVATLGIRSAERRLIYDKTDTAIPGVQETLWQTALRIEEGDMAMAQRDLRAAQQALEEALADESVSDAEIQRLMDELEQAMDRFLQEMARQMQRQMQQGAEPQPLPPNAQVMERRDLQEMMERMRDMAESGARESARQMLQQMREMMENLQAGRMMSPQQSQQAQQAQEMMQQMRSLAERQQELLDQSFRMQQQMQGQQGQRGQQGLRQPGQQGQQGQQGQRGQQGQQGMGQRGQGQQPGMSDQAARQEALRRSLGRTMRDLSNMLGNIPGPLGQAEQQMRDATRALQQGQPGQATGPQQQALDQLRQGMNAMQQQMQQQMQMGQQGQPGPGQGRGQPGWNPGQQRDPLGRAREEGGTAASGDEVQIPSESEMQRAREILDELRQRSGDRSRPGFELDYIERLLNRF